MTQLILAGNQGLIVGKTDVFLLEPKRADIMQQKRVALVESHETAHMWYAYGMLCSPS